MERLRTIAIPESFDLIVAIAGGGIVPAGILAQRLGGEFAILSINFRDEHQKPRFDTPRLLSPIGFDARGKRVLLVDDRIKSGSTIRLARELMIDAGALSVRTFAVNGDADYALWNEECFRLPWIL